MMVILMRKIYEAINNGVFLLRLLFEGSYYCGNYGNSKKMGLPQSYKNIFQSRENEAGRGVFHGETCGLVVGLCFTT